MARSINIEALDQKINKAEQECLVYNKNTQNCRGDSPKLQREIPQ